MNFSQAALEHGNLLQQLSLKKAALSIFCSDWAAETAIENYQVDQSRIKVLPFGANLLEIPTPEEISTAIEQRSQASGCRLLFMGVDWERKGGDLVLATAEILHRSGTKVSVDIVGCQPPGAVPDYVHTHGFISKSTAVGRAKIKSLLLAAHYLFVPSIAECYGLVFAEASAFGVPSLARATGGIPSAVSNGINGWAFDIDASPTAYAGYITGQLASQGTYRASALRARQFYEERLNWRVAIDTLESLLTGLAKH
jgi:glycosyltransferase involved in cell wall biosynthesis